MELSALVKSPMFIGGVSTVGLGGAGIGGWVVYDGYRPTARQRMEDKKLKLNTLDPTSLGVFDSSSNVSFTYKDNPTANPSACFKNFFPGAETVSLTSATGSTDSTPDSPTVATPGTTQGCTLAQLAYKYEEEGSDDNKTWKLAHFDFKSEVVFKNEKVGWAIWTLFNGSEEADTVKSNGKKVFHYYVAFLEKDDKDKGNIKGGYKWADTYGTDPTSKHIKIEILNELGLSNKLSPETPVKDNSWHTKQFLGSGGETDSSGKGILNEMEVQTPKGNPSNLQKQCEVLCKEQEDKTFASKTVGKNYPYKPGFSYYTYFLFKDGNTGKANSSQQQVDITSKLDNWFAPFKDKRGKWTELQDNFCQSTGEYKGLSEKELDNFESLCYTKSA